MSERTNSGADESRISPDSSQYDMWFDGLLDEDRARAQAERVKRDPKQSARFEIDRAIENSLQRSFSPQAAPRRQPAGPVGLSSVDRPARARIHSSRVRIAAGALILVGLFALLIAYANRETKLRRVNVAVPENTTHRKPMNAQLVADVGRTRKAHFALGDVFLDALAREFQPQLDCKSKDHWDAELLAQLETAPCNQEQGVVVLGEWLDPRVDVANMVMLRRGENPIMLVVPRCELETELCVSQDSGLYVHRGVRDGRTIYEISPVPGSEVLACVDAQAVVTQHQL